MGNIENNNTIENTSFKIPKEVFSNEYYTYIEANIYNFLYKNKLIDDRSKIELKQYLSYNIYNKLLELGIQQSSINKNSISEKGILKISFTKNGKSNSLYFDLNQNLKDLLQNPKKNILLGDDKELKKKKTNDRKFFIKTIPETERLLNAMDEVFKQNDEEWGFGELNDNDRLKTDKFGDELVGLNLKDLQKLFKEKFDKLRKIPKENLSKKMVIELVKQETLYLKMLMGIGDKYEGGAALFKKDEKYFESLADSIVNHPEGNSAMIKQLKKFHKEIDDNNYQSETVQESYRTLAAKLHQKIFDKLARDPKTEDADLIEFARIISGKGYDIDDNLRDPDLAQETLILVMNRKGGAIDKYINSGELNIDDSEIQNKNPKSIVDDVRKRFYKKYGKKIESQKLFNKTLENAGYGDILDIPADKKYSDLTFYQKNKLSVLYRVAEKMEKGRSIGEILETGTTKAMSLSNPYTQQKYILADFAGLFNEVAIDYIEDVADKLDDSFTEWSGLKAKTAEDLGLDPESPQGQAFEVFQDIRGAGFFDLSDDSIARMKTTGKFVGIMGVAMLAPAIILPTSATLVTQGTVAGAAASVAGWGIDPKGYDTVSEAVADTVTDVGLGAVTGGAGGKLAQKLGGGKFLSRQFYKNDKFVMALDLTFLGLGPEVLRQQWVKNNFSRIPVLEKTEK